MIKIDSEHRLIIFFGAALGALIGSYLVGAVEKPAALAHFNFLYLLQNKTIVGGLLGGLIGVEAYQKK